MAARPALRTTTCAACGKSFDFYAPHPGNYRLVCRHCGKTTTTRIAGERPAHEPVTFHKATRFRRLSHFQPFYRAFQSIADHVPHERWPFLAIYATLIVVAEALVVVAGATPGIAIHGMVLLLMFAHAAAFTLHSDRLSKFVTALSLVPLVRIISLAVPLGRLGYLEWILLGGAVLFVAGLATARTLGVSVADLGLQAPRMRTWLVILPVALFGIAIGTVEYVLLRPGALIDATSVTALVGPGLLVMVLTGVPEELLFRGLILQTARPVYGAAGAVVIAATAQALLALAFLNPTYMIVVFASGALFGAIALWSDDLVGVSLAHGLSNVMLFLVLPTTGLPWG